MNHSRKTVRRYNTLLKNDTKLVKCAFCDDNLEEPSIEQHQYIYLVPNRTKYDFWEGHTVAEHYMIIPKRHVESLADLSDDEMLDVIKVTAKYEALGFNVYARGKDSPRKSVKHQHTHLIKFADHKRAKFSLYMQKPYVLVNFG